MLVNGYVRVSTQEQAKEGYSIGAQTEKLQAYCVARGWTLNHIYTDPGYSGAKMARPGLQQLIADAKAKKVDLVLVYKLDRLSRSQKDTLYLIEDVFIKNNVAFASLNENFDTSTAFGRAMVGILSVFAQLEREQIKERTLMGRTERAKAGYWKGGGFVPVGYDYIEATNELCINEYEAMQVREIFDLFVNQNLSLHKIQGIMLERGYTYKSGSWLHDDRIKKVLASPLYIGMIQWNGVTYQGRHAPIIPKELFDKAQKRLAAITTKGRSPDFSPYKYTQLLTGILYCKLCGARYYGAGAYRGPRNLPGSQKTYYHVYVCYSRGKSKRHMIKDPNCKNKRWPAEQLDRIILEEIKKLYSDSTYFDGLVAAAPIRPDKGAALSQRIADLDNQIAKLLDLYQYKEVPTNQIISRIKGLTAEKDNLESELEGLDEDDRPTLSVSDAQKLIGNAKEVLDQGTLEEQRNLVHSLIKRIDIENENLYITWRFL